MEKSCYSCGMPLNGTDGKDYFGNYCKYCVDDNGKLKDKNDIQKGIAFMLEQNAPNEQKSANFMKRAEHYMLSMPEWAQD